MYAAKYSVIKFSTHKSPPTSVSKGESQAFYMLLETLWSIAQRAVWSIVTNSHYFIYCTTGVFNYLSCLYEARKWNFLTLVFFHTLILKRNLNYFPLTTFLHSYHNLLRDFSLNNSIAFWLLSGKEHQTTP